ncbi:hypothetical protein LXL04_037927 [Taraxacum kok-saghyz]
MKYKFLRRKKLRRDFVSGSPRFSKQFPLSKQFLNSSPRLGVASISLRSPISPSRPPSLPTLPTPTHDAFYGRPCHRHFLAVFFCTTPKPISSITASLPHSTLIHPHRSHHPFPLMCCHHPSPRLPPSISTTATIHAPPPSHHSLHNIYSPPDADLLNLSLENTSQGLHAVATTR